MDQKPGFEAPEDLQDDDLGREGESSAESPRGIFLSQERHDMLWRMERAAQDMAECVVRYFKNRDVSARKALIERAAEVLRENPRVNAAKSEPDTRSRN